MSNGEKMVFDILCNKNCKIINSIVLKLFENFDGKMQNNDMIMHIRNILTENAFGGADLAIKRYMFTYLCSYDTEVMKMLNQCFDENKGIHGELSQERFNKWNVEVQDNLDKELLHIPFDVSNIEKIVDKYNGKNKKLYVMGIYHKLRIGCIISAHYPHFTLPATVGVN